MNDTTMKGVVEYVHQVKTANMGYAHLWVTHVLGTWQWWIQLIMVILSVVFWIIVRKRTSTGRLLIAGLFALSTSMWLDFIGSSFELWYYPYKLIPSIPPVFPWESVIPIEILLLLQYRPSLSPWIKAMTIGAINSFIFEPLMEQMGVYVRVHWRHIYSFPIYIILYLIAHRLAQMKTFKRLVED